MCLTWPSKWPTLTILSCWRAMLAPLSCTFTQVHATAHVGGGNPTDVRKGSTLSIGVHGSVLLNMQLKQITCLGQLSLAWRMLINSRPKRKITTGTARLFVYVYIQRKPHHVYEYPAGSAPVAHTSPVTKRQLCMGYLGHTLRKVPACPVDMDLNWNDTESLHKEKLVLTRKDLRW